MKKILVLNSGSSSLKYQLFAVDGDKYEVIAKGLADRIGIDNSFVTIKIRDGEKITKNVDIPSHQEAIREVFALLLNELTLKKLKRPIQTIVYLPYFLSRVILAKIVLNIFG